MQDRMAVIESKVKRNEHDLNKVFELLNELSERQLKDRKECYKLLHAIDSKLITQKSFIGGIIFAFTAITSIIVTGFDWIKG